MIRIKSLAVLICVSLTLTIGCKNSPAPAPASSQPTNSYTQAAVAAGGTLNSDGSVKNPNGSITEPNGTVVPPAQSGISGQAGQQLAAGSPPPPAPNQPYSNQPNPAPVANGPSAAPAPVAVTAPRGTPVTVRATEEISAIHTGDGGRWTGVVERPVVYHGITIFERGASVSGVVVAAKRKGNFKGAGDLSIVVTDIGHNRVHTSAYTLVNKGRGKRTAGFIGGGGGVGALIGGLAGGGKGALIGGLAGAGAGTAVGATTGSKDVVIRPESIITFRLTEPVTR
jgi:hypothetical protein